ncbi:MAG: phosphoribosylamine--glycine ligase [Burkholderiales bacterium]|nr:phosphoribosylamine--glycine ligase [Burkholderiales bacterium]
MLKKNILIIGSGGREHALAWKISKSKHVNMIFVAPGNGGTATEKNITNINLHTISELITFAKQNDIFFTVVGPEVPLANGIVDEFRAHDLKIWGPTKFCAQLESSKVFSKAFMLANNIPTAKYQSFSDYNSAKNYIAQQNFPLVIKADGLAAGKGVVIANNNTEAINFIQEIFNNNKFGSAGSKVVIEEFIQGVEASFIVMVDGNNILPMATSQDNKRLLDNDIGPNTGGMGASCPAPIVTQSMHQKIINEIIQPVLDGFKKLGHTYTGFLYAGIMIDTKGNPQTLEFNCRFGDPETQPILYRLNSDLFELIEAGLNCQLDQIKAQWFNQFSIGVVIASQGYPNISRNNDIIYGLEQMPANVKIFHAGTKYENNQYLTNGGRVLCVVSMADKLADAQTQVYEAVKKINFNCMQYRTDIGNKAIFI